MFDKVSNTEEVWYNEKFVKDHGELEFNRGVFSLDEERRKLTIEFAKWFREADTEKNAEEFANFSDEDMYNHFIKNVYGKSNK